MTGTAKLNALLCNPKNTANFFSCHWNTGFNLAFCSIIGPDSRLPKRRVLEKFPWTQHRLSLIILTRLILLLPGRSVVRWNFRKANWSNYVSLTNKTARKLAYYPLISLTWTRHTSIFVLPPTLQHINLSHAVLVKIIHWAGTLIVKHYTNTFSNFWMITSLVELLHLYLPGLIRSAELVGQRWSKTLTFHTPAEKHGALQIISVAGQDAPPHHCPIPANVKNDSSSETKNAKVLIASLLDSYQK